MKETEVNPLGLFSACPLSDLTFFFEDFDVLHCIY